MNKIGTGKVKIQRDIIKGGCREIISVYRGVSPAGKYPSGRIDSSDNRGGFEIGIWPLIKSFGLADIEDLKPTTIVHQRQKEEVR